jgi:hypothetical protein
MWLLSREQLGNRSSPNCRRAPHLTRKSSKSKVHPNSIERATVGTTVSGRGNDLLGSYVPEKLTRVAKPFPAEQKSGFAYVRLHGSNDEHRGSRGG